MALFIGAARMPWKLEGGLHFRRAARELYEVVLLFPDRRRLDVVHIWKRLRQVGVPRAGDAALIRFFAVLRVDLLDDVHALRHFTKRREPLRVEEPVVLIVDEHLRAARVRLTRIGECDIALLVALL